jgi:hypothetical protein
MAFRYSAIAGPRHMEKLTLRPVRYYVSVFTYCYITKDAGEAFVSLKCCCIALVRLSQLS